MANEDQINLDLLAENARQRERINVLEARYAREQGVVSGLREALVQLKEVAQALGIKGADYLTQWSDTAVQRDKLIAAGGFLEDIVYTLTQTKDGVPDEQVKHAIEKWQEATNG